MKGSGISYGGYWRVEGYRNNKLVWIEIIHNLVVNEALDYALDVKFKGATQYSTWYIGLFSSNSTPSATWEYANIGTDFTEFDDYDELTRIEWVSGTVSSQLVSNSASPAEFTASTGVDTTLYGAFLTNVNIKSDNASAVGIIYCATKFTTPRPFVAAEQVKIVYQVRSQAIV